MLQQFQLKNKMKVLMVESHKAPVVTVQMWVKTGSADEKKNQEGISHFIEHLVFKGTKKYGVGELAMAVEGAGGEINAYTTLDHTVFHVTISKEFMEVALDCISEMMGFPRFDPEEIDKEREVVIEEIKRSFDNPKSVGAQRLFSTVYKSHPYGVPVIGFTKNIKTVKTKTLTDYYNNRYVPANMTLVVAGDFQKTDLKKKIDNYFAKFKAKTLKKISRTKEVSQKQPRIDYFENAFRETTFHIAFRVPEAKHPDVPALDILGNILGRGDSSRLVRKLRLEKSLVLSVSAGSYNPLDPGLFAFSITFDPSKFNEINEILIEEIKRIISEPPTQSELGRARLNTEAEHVFSLETVDGLARKVGTCQLFLKDPEYISTYLKQVQALKPEDIRKAAQMYFRAETMTATIMVNKEEAKSLPENEFKKFVNEFGRQLKLVSKLKPKKQEIEKSHSPTIKIPLKMNAGESKIHKHRLSNGALVLLKHNAEVPVLHVKVGFLGGLRIEPLENLGATTLLASTWTSGTKLFNENEIAAQIEDCAGAISAFGGRNSAGVSMSTLTVYEERAHKIFSDVLLHPQFPNEIVTREASIQTEAILRRTDSPASLASQYFMEIIFEGHPYSKDLLGTNKTISTIDSDVLKNHWSKMAGSNNCVLVAVGDFNLEKQLKEFEHLAGGLQKGKAYNEILEIEPLREDKKVFYNFKKEQSHIILGYRGLSFKDSDRFALQILQAVLSGQGGRLFLELRDKASLAYSVAPIHMDGMDTGYFGVYIGCSPEKGKTAIKMIHEELEKVMTKPISANELSRSKRYLIGKNHIDLQRNSSQASSILFDEIYGIDSEETFHYAEHIKNIRVADIQKVAQRILSGRSVTVAVGPEAPW